MCERLGQLREAMGRYAVGFDASLLSCEGAAAVVAEAARIENLAATVKARAAARSAAGEGWKAAGDRSAAAHLARATGSSVRAAGEVLETARRLERLPALAGAARAGELSAAQVAAVADAGVVDPSAETRLVDIARSSSLAELREHCGRAKASAHPDAEARRRAIHDRRFLRSWTDAEGAWNLRMRANPEVGAVVMAAIEALRDRLFRQARSEGRQEPAQVLHRRCPGGAGHRRRHRRQDGIESQDHRAGGPAGAAAGPGGPRGGLRGGRLRARGGLRGARPRRHR